MDTQRMRKLAGIVEAAEELHEAEQISQQDLSPTAWEALATILDLLRGSKFHTAWSGVHGEIVTVKWNAGRVFQADLKQLAVLKGLRWMEFTDTAVSIGI